MYRAYLKTEAVKMMFQKKMRNIKKRLIVLFNSDGSFKVTDPEGFVVGSMAGRAMKIVDRLEFSAANFNPEIKMLSKKCKLHQKKSAKHVTNILNMLWVSWQLEKSPMHVFHAFKTKMVSILCK